MLQRPTAAVQRTSREDDMDRLLPVRSESDILPAFRHTPIGKLLAYHNLGVPPLVHEKAELLIGMCMDNRKSLRIPENFAYIIRAEEATFAIASLRSPMRSPLAVSRPSRCWRTPTAAWSI